MRPDARADLPPSGDAAEGRGAALLVCSLVALWPLVNFLAYNRAERLDLGPVALWAAGALAGAFVVAGVLKLVSLGRLSTRAALSAGGVAIAGLLSYDIVAQVSAPYDWRPAVRLAVWGLLWLVSIGVTLKLASRPAVVRAAAFAVTVIVVVRLAQFAYFAAAYGVFTPARSNQGDGRRADVVAAAAGLPNVYYFILDMYSRADVLAKYYGFDNREFITFLENRGFRVLPRSHANYRATEESVTTTLFMDYLIPTSSGGPPDSATPVLASRPACARWDFTDPRAASRVKPYKGNAVEQIPEGIRLTVGDGADAAQGAYAYLDAADLGSCDYGPPRAFELVVGARLRGGSGVRLRLTGAGAESQSAPLPLNAFAERKIAFSPRSKKEHFFLFSGLATGDGVDLAWMELRAVAASPVVDILRRITFNFAAPPELWNAYLGSSQVLIPALKTFHELGYRELFANQAGTQADGCAPFCLYGQALWSAQTVMMLRLTPYLDALQLRDPDELTRRLAAYQKDPLDVVRKIPFSVPQPYYLHAHILAPHPPFIYRSDCSIRDEFRFELDPRVAIRHSDEEATPLYLEQLKCVNRLMSQAVDEILQRDPSALIVIQSDHGRSRVPVKMTHEDAVRARFGTLSAFRVPDACKQYLPDDLANVNTFRFVFACLAGEPPNYVPSRMFDGDRRDATEIELVANQVVSPATSSPADRIP